MDVEIENYMKTLNIDEICRTCLSECDEMISVYTEIEPTDEDDISYVYQILMNVASIQIMMNDGLPTLICKNCVENANNAFKFKILCERSETLLQTYLTQIALQETLPVKTDNETPTKCAQNNSVEEVVEMDQTYISDNVECVEVNYLPPLKEMKQCSNIQTKINELPKLRKINVETNGNFNFEYNEVSETEDETIIEHLDEEFQIEDNANIKNEPENTNLKNENDANINELLKSGSFQKIHGDLDLNIVKIEVCNDPTVQELIVKPDIPLQSYEEIINESDEDFVNAAVIASAEENICLRERIKLKPLSNQSRTSKPRRKRNYHHPYRISENGEKLFACSHCQKEYKHSTSLTVHMRSHTLERPYICKICRKSFKQLTALTYHMRGHTGEAPYKCSICSKCYRQSASLTAHMRIHTGQRPFLCSVCGKGFRQAPDLGYHMRTHTKEKPYMCSVCGKRMSMQCHLVQHMRTHTGEKPFSCKECGKSFPSSTRLKRHEIIHTDLKPFSCEVCHKCFNRASSLKVHVMTHSEERPHVCKFCGKGFIQQHCLKSHLKTHYTFDEVFVKTENKEER